MATRYNKGYAVRQLITENYTCDMYECPDCGFKFNSIHEIDVGKISGYECPDCRRCELENGIADVMRFIESKCGTYDNPRRMTMDEMAEVYSMLNKLNVK